MNILSSLVGFIIHIDEHLVTLTTQYGALTYFILFAIIFAETGFVITPFLPGDSLLFAAGAIAALGGLNIFLILFILIIAAVIGDTINYWFGHFFGQKIVDNPRIPFINQKHIDQTQKFYHQHGGKTIILARFVPIVRTFAPFVAGVSKMNYTQFSFYNFTGAVAWILLLTLAGFFFGNIPFIQHNFEYVIFVIIGISLLPMIYEYFKNKQA